MSSSSCDRKRPAGQVCIGEAFSKLAKYERDSGKWKMTTRNVATCAAIPFPQRASADEELTRPLAWKRKQAVSKLDAASQHNRLSLSTWHLNFVSVRHKEDETVYCEGFVVLYHAASSVDSITVYNEFSLRRSCYLWLLSYLTVLFLWYLF